MSPSQCRHQPAFLYSQTVSIKIKLNILVYVSVVPVEALSLSHSHSHSLPSSLGDKCLSSDERGRISHSYTSVRKQTCVQEKQTYSRYALCVMRYSFGHTHVCSLFGMFGHPDSDEVFFFEQLSLPLIGAFATHGISISVSLSDPGL